MARLHLWREDSFRRETGAVGGYRTGPACTSSGRGPPGAANVGARSRAGGPGGAQRSHSRKCGEALGRSIHLAQHHVVHTWAKLHACEEHRKAFSRVTHLSQRRRVHTREKSYRCEACGRTLSDCSALIQHLRTPERSPIVVRFVQRPLRRTSPSSSPGGSTPARSPTGAAIAGRPSAAAPHSRFT